MTQLEAIRERVKREHSRWIRVFGAGLFLSHPNALNPTNHNKAPSGLYKFKKTPVDALYYAEPLKHYDSRGHALLSDSNISLCIMIPQFNYATHAQQLHSDRLKHPASFVPPNVAQALTDQNVLVTTKNDPKFSLWPNRADGCSGGVLLVMCHLDITPEGHETVESEKQLLQTLATVQDAYASFGLRLICCVLLKEADKANTSSYARYRAETKAKIALKVLRCYQADIYWIPTTADVSVAIETCIHHAANLVAALEKSRLRPPPSAFRVRLYPNAEHQRFAERLDPQQKNWFLQILQIPGIQLSTAEVLVTRFPHGEALLNHFTLLSEKEALKTIADMKVIRPHGSRRIGNALAQRLEFKKWPEKYTRKTPCF